MKCPVCGEHSPPSWESFYTTVVSGRVSGLRKSARAKGDVWLAWMRCGNEECEEVIIVVHEQGVTGQADGGDLLMRTDSWIARPRFGEAQRPIDPLVEEPFRTDYLEAAAILDMSHRMSAVLARKIMSDLLKRYAGRDEKRLTQQINAFVAEGGHPIAITSGLHHVREAADMSAHTQEDKEAVDPVVIEIDREEAEWTLDFVDLLFEHFIVRPAKHEAIKARIEEKGSRAGRNSIKPTSEDAEKAT